ncbi:glycohydrolase toxin TNT-related protein [Demequina sp. NBRC 110053]|uniref:WXG100-like domain-containing protein n=1 Tax=Demequina sp. NBRC 110053 TaxID=1570342 RepID=UPI000A023AEC|nr:glycohydrolase toxin TNT-related protein [Demequina sp. NBRC 110053]
MPTLDLDPRDYATAGDNALARERALSRVIGSASSGLSGGYNMAGSDDGGERFAQAYDTAARGIFDAADDAADGARNLGRALIYAGALHSAAERGARGETGAGPGFADPGAGGGASTAYPPTSSGGNPMPVPGLEMIIDFLGGLLWPDADTDRLRNAADAWSQFSRDLTSEATELRRVAADLSGITSGEKSGFDERVNELADRLDEIAQAVGGGEGIASQCTSYAQQVDDTREQSLIMLRDLAIEIAATVAVSAALSFVTFGGAAAVGAGAVAARTAWYGARIATLITRLRAVAMTVATKLDDLVASVRALQRWRAWQATGSLGSKVTFEAVTDGVGVFGASFLTADDTNPFLAGATAMGGGAFANVLTSNRYLDNFAGRVFGGQISAATEYGAITAIEGEEFNLTDLFMSVGLGTVGAGVTGVFGGKTRAARDITSGQHQAELGAGGMSSSSLPANPTNTGAAAGGVAADGRSGPNPDFDGPQTGASDPGSDAGADGPVSIQTGDAPTVGASDATAATPTGGGTPVPQGEAPVATGGDAGGAAPQGSAATPPAGEARVASGGDGTPSSLTGDPAPVADATPATPSSEATAAPQAAPAGSDPSGATAAEPAPTQPLGDVSGATPEAVSPAPAQTPSPIDIADVPVVDGSQALAGTDADVANAAASTHPGATADAVADGDGSHVSAVDETTPNSSGDGHADGDGTASDNEAAAAEREPTGTAGDDADGEMAGSGAPADAFTAAVVPLPDPNAASAPLLTPQEVLPPEGQSVDASSLTTSGLPHDVPQLIDMEPHVDATTLLGSSPDGTPNDLRGFQEHFMRHDSDGKPTDLDWPPHDGAVPGTTRRATVAVYQEVFGSDVFTRAGSEFGSFGAPISHGQYYTHAQSSLAPRTLFDDFHHYRFTADADAKLSDSGITMVVEQVAPALGRPGGGMQMRWVSPEGENVSILHLKAKGIFEEVYLP